MALIHERLYQSATLARIDFGEYARSLTAFLFRSYKVSAAVELKVDVEAADLNIETAVPLGLLLNELVSNALKHAFADGRVGALRVSLHPASGGFSLTVADTGPGLPGGFDLAQAKSMGMSLVHSLARQLKADLVVTSDGGACFRLDFKELTYATR
jgi:two-component sensor histidine kinase